MSHLWECIRRIFVFMPQKTPNCPLKITPKSIARKTKPIFVKIISNLRKIISNLRKIISNLF